MLGRVKKESGGVNITSRRAGMLLHPEERNRNPSSGVHTTLRKWRSDAGEQHREMRRRGQCNKLCVASREKEGCGERKNILNKGQRVRSPEHTAMQKKPMADNRGERTCGEWGRTYCGCEKRTSPARQNENPSKQDHRP